MTWISALISRRPAGLNNYQYDVNEANRDLGHLEFEALKMHFKMLIKHWLTCENWTGTYETRMLQT